MRAVFLAMVLGHWRHTKHYSTIGVSYSDTYQGLSFGVSTKNLYFLVIFGRAICPSFFFLAKNTALRCTTVNITKMHQLPFHNFLPLPVEIIQTKTKLYNIHTNTGKPPGLDSAKPLGFEMAIQLWNLLWNSPKQGGRMISSSRFPFAIFIESEITSELRTTNSRISLSFCNFH